MNTEKQVLIRKIILKINRHSWKAPVLVISYQSSNRAPQNTALKDLMDKTDILKTSKVLKTKNASKPVITGMNNFFFVPQAKNLWRGKNWCKVFRVSIEYQYKRSSAQPAEGPAPLKLLEHHDIMVPRDSRVTQMGQHFIKIKFGLNIIFKNIVEYSD